MCIYIYIYIYVHTHTYIHTYIHTYMHTYIHTYIHTHTHTDRHSFVKAKENKVMMIVTATMMIATIAYPLCFPSFSLFAGALNIYHMIYSVEYSRVLYYITPCIILQYN